MNTLSCDIKKLLQKLEVLDDYDVEHLFIEHLQISLSTLDELQQSYQRHYLNIIRTLLQQLSLLPALQHEPVQKRLAFLDKLLTYSPSLRDLETLHRGLDELRALGPLPTLAPPSDQIIGDPPTGTYATSRPHPAPAGQSEVTDKIQSIQKNNDHFSQAVEKILQIIEHLGQGVQLDAVQQDLKDQAQHLLHGQHQLALHLEQIQQQLAGTQARNKRLQEELQQARALSLTDELTGLPNRRAFLRRMEEEVVRVQRHPEPLTLAIIDLDHFKQINDRYGHQVGDEVLKAYAQHALSVFRRHDHVARFGGEEFIVLLPNTDMDGAVKALGKIYQRSADHAISLGATSIYLPTFSAGVARYRPDETASCFIERADQALYRAKEGGRNRIECADQAE
ncbi:GGDEF domain-containing protein [Methylohalobius crimeensis]|uniref:GGDEF domain-containing protein n=1 Tax=Methylohalobius crimeensis TaxID=244365 RepID=UPI0003B351E9|nr:GGDEF domain-containing protein [Methylohalobius crimeensis]